MHRALVCWLCTLLCLVATRARAQATPVEAARAEATHAEAIKTPEQRARALFETGLEHSRAERWAEAAAAFEASASLLARPSTLQNLVAALRRLNRREAAILAIDRYLALTDERQHAETRSTLSEARVELARQLAQANAGDSRLADGHDLHSATLPSQAKGADTQTKPASAHPLHFIGSARQSPAHSARSHGRRILAWTSLASGAALAVSGAALLLSSELDTQRWRERCETQECSVARLAGPQRSIDRRDRTGYALSGLAVAAAVTGAALFWVELRAERRQLSLGLGPVGTRLRLRF